jgi:hypothetical protein
LPQGRAYQFRYLVDYERWMTDEAPDAYADNPYGSDNAVVQV